MKYVKNTREPIPYWRDGDGRFYIEVPRSYAKPKNLAQHHLRKLLFEYEGLSELTPFDFEECGSTGVSFTYREVF